MTKFCRQGQIMRIHLVWDNAVQCTTLPSKILCAEVMLDLKCLKYLFCIVMDHDLLVMHGPLGRWEDIDTILKLAKSLVIILLLAASLSNHSRGSSYCNL